MCSGKRQRGAPGNNEILVMKADGTNPARWTHSTAGDISAVGELDGRTIGDGRIGPVTWRIRDGYQALLESGEKSTPV